MKTLRQLCVASVFVFALAISALAGEIQTPLAPPQPTQSAPVNGEIQTGITGQEETGNSEATAAAFATEIVLNLLQSVQALF